MTTHTDSSELKHRRLMRRVVAASAVLLGLLIVTLMLQSCGGAKSESASAGAETQAQPVVVENATQPGAGVIAAPAVAEASAPNAEAPSDALPPEIALRDPSTHVLPGQAVTILVDGTPDVTQMVLSDGINDPQALVRDASGDGSWQAAYRVPLRPRDNRIGLSVTAKNQSGRWRRVWLFLEVVKPETAATDSLTQH